MYFEIDDYNALKHALQRLCAGLEECSVPEETVFDSKLVANELLSNVLQHGGGKAYFYAELKENEITLSVKSACRFRPPEISSCADVDSECGRGLFLVDRLSSARDYSEERGICVIIKIEK